ncbi:flavin reductase family protein [Niveispirillum sp.]|uniref:flavin reductase family protein n=1 Tax=Niveispirillum sp. TaxID=1917217 RepID=UPI001B55581C|nr:flavin reductase family protein [Niveispirillum sp.]MBP7340355.1 flavin reductase family protein [Niveispirillum sp.]
MRFDMRALPPAARYKIMTSAITPRPIAWVTTLSAEGVRNAAPFSFFNMVGDDPPLVALGLMHRPDGRLKDTTANILETGEFTVNLVSEDDAERMNRCSADAPPGVDELAYAGIETAPASLIRPPLIASAPVSFECRRHTVLETGPRQTLVLGEVLAAHVADRFILDAASHYLDTPAMKLIGRTHGRGWYVRNGETLQMDRPPYDPDWRP